MAAPTFVQHVESVWNTTTTPKTVTISGNAGDVIVVGVANENGSGTFATPTNNGAALTWTPAQNAGTTNVSCRVAQFTAVLDTTRSVVITATRAGTAVNWGMCAEVWRGSAGVGASSIVNGDATANFSVDITTTQDNSAVVCVGGDFNEVTGARTWLTTGVGAFTSKTSLDVPGAFFVAGGYYADAGTAGLKTVGTSAPSGQKVTLAAVEIKGTGATPVSQTFSAVLEAAQGTNVIGGGAYEAQVAVPATISSPVEATAGVTSTSSLTLEASTGVASIASSVLDVAGPGQAGASAPYDVSQVAQATTSTSAEASQGASMIAQGATEAAFAPATAWSTAWEAAGGALVPVAQTFTATFEASTSLAGGGSGSLDTTTNAAMAVSSAVEAAASAGVVASTPTDAGSALAFAPSTPWDAASLPAVVVSAAYETTAAPASTVTAPWEASGGAVTLVAQTFSAAWDAAAVGAVILGLPAEGIGSMTTAVTTGYETPVALTLTAGGPWASTAGLALGVGSPLEARGLISAAAAVPWEALSVGLAFTYAGGHSFTFPDPGDATYPDPGDATYASTGLFTYRT